MPDLDAQFYGAEAPLIDPHELPNWVVYEDDHVLALNKPGWLVCHPSKNGPWSSLAGAVREHWQLDQVHMVARLDRETSGLVLFAKHGKAARVYQMAMSQRRVEKHYRAVMVGEFPKPPEDSPEVGRFTVNIPLVNDRKSLVHVKVKAQKGQQGQKAITHLKLLKQGEGFFEAAIDLETGRKHQIRAHAEWLGTWVVGDKIYGPDAIWFLDFIEKGWTPEMAEAIHHPRQLLHCERMVFELEEAAWACDFQAPIQPDYQQFCLNHGLT